MESTESNDDDHDRLEAIHGSIRDFATDTIPLFESDYRLFGRFIQAFCVADFSARRVVVAMRGIMSMPEINVAMLPDKDVIAHLIRCGESWSGQRDIADGVIKAGRTLEMHHSIRHSMAHWAARRLRDHDAYYFLTTSENHKAPPGGRRIDTLDDEPNANFRLLPATGIREELVKLEDHAQWLSDLYNYLQTNSDELKAGYGGR